MRKLAYEVLDPYCFSKNLLRKVDRAAMTEEKLHCDNTRIRNSGFMSRRAKYRGNSESTQQKCLNIFY